MTQDTPLPSAAPAMPGVATTAIPSDPAAVMACFESLGDTCEFGFVQRHYGIEPISLLRWVGAPLPGLLDALRARFVGIYRREDLVAIDGGSVLDLKYDLRFHAGRYAQDGGSGKRPVVWTEEALAAYAREQRYVRFLLRTTLDTLANRSRILVYKTNAGLDLLDILQLKAALDLYGPQRLLCVLPGSERDPPGRARLVATGVKVAGISRFAPYTCQDDIDAPCWLSLCASALEAPWGDEAVAPPGRAGTPSADAPDPKASPEASPEGPPAFELTERGIALYNPALARGVVTALYHTLLLRSPDGDGLQALSGSLSRGEVGLEDVIASALSSEEFAGLVPRFLQRYVRS